MATKEIIDGLQKAIDGAIATPIDQLITDPSRWGPINFEPGRQVLGRTFEMLAQLKILPVDLLPEPIAANIKTHIDPFAAVVNEIRQFSIEQGGDPQGRRQDILNRLNQSADAFFNVAQGYIPFLAYQRGDIEKNIAELTGAVTKGKHLIDEARKDVELKQKEVADIISAAREAAASVGVAHFTEDFRGEANRLDTTAGKWMWATIVLAFLTLFVAVAAIVVPLFVFSAELGTVGAQVSKVALIAVLFTATLWVGRIYKALMHQASVTRHRANALKTFQAFVKATDNPQIRDAVLIETTKSIFSQSASGFIDPKADQGDSSTTVLELVRDSAKKSA